MISLEREKGQLKAYQQMYQQNQYQPRGDVGWNRNKDLQEQRIPNPLASTNMVNQEEIPWCLPCDEPHHE